MGIHYHPNKANVVVDALGRKPTPDSSPTPNLRPEFIQEFAKLNMLLVPKGTVAHLEI